MQNFHNIEKSGFRRGEYVGYAGGAWRIAKCDRGWIARQQNGGQSFVRRTLAEISKALDVTAEHYRTAPSSTPESPAA